MTIEEWQRDLIGMVLDINAAEIGSHLEDLPGWCKVWQAEMIRRIYEAPVIGIRSGEITVPVKQRVIELGKETKIQVGDDPNYLNTITTAGANT